MFFSTCPTSFLFKINESSDLVEFQPFSPLEKITLCPSLLDFFFLSFPWFIQICLLFWSSLLCFAVYLSPFKGMWILQINHQPHPSCLSPSVTFSTSLFLGVNTQSRGALLPVPFSSSYSTVDTKYKWYYIIITKYVIFFKSHPRFWRLCWPLCLFLYSFPNTFPVS